MFGRHSVVWVWFCLAVIGRVCSIHPEKLSWHWLTNGGVNNEYVVRHLPPDWSSLSHIVNRLIFFDDCWKKLFSVYAFIPNFSLFSLLPPLFLTRHRKVCFFYLVIVDSGSKHHHLFLFKLVNTDYLYVYGCKISLSLHACREVRIYVPTSIPASLISMQEP